GIIFFTVFLDLLGFGLVLPLLPQFAKQHGASEAIIGVLGATYSAFQFVFAPLWGRLSDRVGRRPVLLISITGSSLSYLLFALAPNLATLFLARALAGVMAANIGTAQAYVADVTSPENRARGMGLIGAAFGLGFVFGPALALVVQGQRAVGLLAAALSLLDLLLASVWLPESLPRQNRVAQAPSGAGRLTRMVAALSYPVVGTGVRCFFLATLAWSGLEVTLSLLLKLNAAALLGVPNADQAAALVQARTGMVFALMGLLVATVQGGMIGRLAKRYGEARLAATGALLASAALLLLPWSPSSWALLAVLALLAVGQGMNIPALSALISQNTPSSEQGGALGTTQGYSSLARAVGPALAGGLFHVSPWLPFAAGAALMALAAFLAACRLIAPAAGSPV
ncbi:MAG: MFS transporter, partial [Armatimonadetes bacterium]|nr:MFS transporter [Armatimonadota bacterium]